MTHGSRSLNPPGLPAILLSIRPEHAERIFQGSKRYELRKVLPAFQFGRVYLYETGGRGVVGSFDVGSVIRRKVDPLWKITGNAATTRERFYSYFGKLDRGYAIEVRNPVRFKDSLIRPLNGLLAGFSPPQSFVIIDPRETLYSDLEYRRALSLPSHPPVVSLRRISHQNRRNYERQVVENISKNYEGIDKSFAKSNLKVHDFGHDPVGFFTARKEVLEIWSGRRLVGFTTLTYKSGGCVKTGPTILFKKFRRRGLGLATRKAIEERISPRARKIYATCPEREKNVINYLLASGMRIEAHLERHYATTHNELVFGKLLVTDEPLEFRARRALPNLRGQLWDPASFSRRILVADFAHLFGSTWSPVSRRFARAIISQAVKPEHRQKAKPKKLLCLEHHGRCVAAMVLLTKRGGAVKGVCLRGTSHLPSLRALLDAACALSLDLGGRKIYFLHPLTDSPILRLLRSASFQSEGLIRAPYRAGQDAVVMSRFL